MNIIEEYDLYNNIVLYGMTNVKYYLITYSTILVSCQMLNTVFLYSNIILHHIIQYDNVSWNNDNNIRLNTIMSHTI